MHAEPTPVPSFSYTRYWPSVLPFFSAADIADPKNVDLLASAEVINDLLEKAGYPNIPVKYVFISYDFPGRRRTRTIFEGKAKGSIFLGVALVDMYKFVVNTSAAISKAVGTPIEVAAMFLYMNTKPLVYALAGFTKDSEVHTPFNADVLDIGTDQPDAEEIVEGFLASAEYTATQLALAPRFVDADYVREEAAKALRDSLWALNASASEIPEELLTSSEQIAGVVESRYT